MEFLVSRISDEGILGMSFLTGQKCTFCFYWSILACSREAILLVDKEGRLFANKIQMPQPTTLLAGIGVQVCGTLVSEPCRPVGLVDNGIYGDTGVAVAAALC